MKTSEIINFFHDNLKKGFRSGDVVYIVFGGHELKVKVIDIYKIEGVEYDFIEGLVIDELNDTSKTYRFLGNKISGGMVGFTQKPRLKW